MVAALGDLLAERSLGKTAARAASPVAAAAAAVEGGLLAVVQAEQAVQVRYMWRLGDEIRNR